MLYTNRHQKFEFYGINQIRAKPSPKLINHCVNKRQKVYKIAVVKQRVDLLYYLAHSQFEAWVWIPVESFGMSE